MVENKAKQDANINQVSSRDFLLSLFDPEEGSDIFIRNVSLLSTDYTALYPRR
jgi:hypothetical protein